MRCPSRDHDNRAERRLCAECGAALPPVCAQRPLSACKRPLGMVSWASTGSPSSVTTRKYLTQRSEVAYWHAETAGEASI